MNIKEKFLQLTTKTYPHGTESELVSYLPEDHLEDGFGNFYIKVGENPTTMFTCHLDTASAFNQPVNHVFVDNFIKTDGSSILGADDKAGMVVLLNMIESKVSGLYFFFVGEERGCIGSSKLAENWEIFDPKKTITKCVSFDRRGTSSVITEQIYGPCCSIEFATALSRMLNEKNDNFNYRPDPTGIYTDSAQFTGLISECTNISVGYYNEHSVSEKQDITHLEQLCDVVCKIDWESLPVVRTQVAGFGDYY